MDMIQTLCVSLLLPLLIFILMKKSRQNRNLRLPPGPRRLPILGNMHQLSEWPHRSLDSLAKIHGPLMYLKLGSIPVLAVSSADMAREIIKDHDLDFTGRPAGAASRKLSYGCRDIVFSPYGEYWRHIRKICVQELLSSQRVQSFRSLRQREVERMIQRVATSKGPINMSELLLSLTNSIICYAAFGTTYGGTGGRFQGIMGDSKAVIIGLGVTDFLPSLEWINDLNGYRRKLDEVFRSLDGFFEEIIEEHSDPRRPPPGHEDFIDVMLRVQKEANQGPPLSRNNIKAVIMDMFLAGTDTTFATLIWAMTEFVRNPKVMRKAQDEVRKVTEGKKKVEEDDLHKLDYLKLVLKEVLRLHPPVPLLVPRECTQLCQINGYDIPLKTRVMVNVWSIMRDPNCWDKPEEFIPERFSDASLDFRGQNFQYIPFSSGRRSCPGLSFGLATLELALASLLYSFDWSLPDGIQKEDMDMREAPGLALQKKTDLFLVATPRMEARP
ncbi:cytochrome P450 71A9-like [Aristolochia californica]|uniref:cytochrome P450 71A9-like n=1 Tax=Aristolochia californica TaxID=171875 RepID=UPI0035E26D58